MLVVSNEARNLATALSRILYQEGFGNGPLGMSFWLVESKRREMRHKWLSVC